MACAANWIALLQCRTIQKSDRDVGPIVTHLALMPTIELHDRLFVCLLLFFFMTVILAILAASKDGDFGNDYANVNGVRMMTKGRWKPVQWQYSLAETPILTFALTLPQVSWASYLDRDQESNVKCHARYIP